jgi:hypothetical protein
MREEKRKGRYIHSSGTAPESSTGTAAVGEPDFQNCHQAFFLVVFSACGLVRVSR